MSKPLVSLPSLDGIKGFVAVGRRMSITLAAQDLCLTQSAVSRQIQTLEEALGMKLLERGHRRIAFTPEGERLFRSADTAVQQIQDVVEALQPSRGAKLVTLTTTVGFAGLWLLPRLGRFIEAHPDIDVRMSAGNRLADLQAEGVDLAIRYGNHHSVPAGAHRLFSETVVPVAHPSLSAGALIKPEQLAQQVLLEFDGPYRPWLQWGEWLAARGWAGVRPRGMLRFNQYDQIIHATVAGQGIALGRQPLVNDMLADGRLVELPCRPPLTGSEPLQDDGHAFWLIQADALPRPEVRKVIDWVLAQSAGLAS